MHTKFEVRYPHPSCSYTNGKVHVEWTQLCQGIWTMAQLLAVAKLQKPMGILRTLYTHTPLKNFGHASSYIRMGQTCTLNQLHDISYLHFMSKGVITEGKLWLKISRTAPET